MKKKIFKDPAGRELFLWDKLPGRISISAPGEGGFIFLADKETTFELIAGLCEWYNEQRSDDELRLELQEPQEPPRA